MPLNRPLRLFVLDLPAEDPSDGACSSCRRLAVALDDLSRDVADRRPKQAGMRNRNDVMPLRSIKSFSLVIII